MEHKQEKKKSFEEEQTPKNYPAKEQGILPKETSEAIEEEMDIGKKEADPYTPEGREVMEDEDELTTVEEGLMEGASGGGQLAKDDLTGEPLLGSEDVVEMEIDGRLYRFVNEENAQKFKEKKEKEE